MGKRQIIYTASQIEGNNDLLDQEVDIVTKADRVWHGRIISIDRSEVVLRDARSGKHKFPLKEVDTIYRDIVTDY